MERRFLTPKGGMLCGALVLLAGALYLGLALSPRGQVAVVERQGEVLARRALSGLGDTETLVVEGAKGVELVVEFSSQGARVAASTCPDQVCVRTGWLTRAGETAVCLPAQVSLRLEGDGDAIDAAVY